MLNRSIIKFKYSSKLATFRWIIVNFGFNFLSILNKFLLPEKFGKAKKRNEKILILFFYDFNESLFLSLFNDRKKEREGNTWSTQFLQLILEFPC